MTLLSLIQAENTEFDFTSALEPADEVGRYSTELSDRWSGLVGIHGGYMTAIAVRAASLFVPDRAVRTVTTNFQRAGKPGPAGVMAQALRVGKNITTVAVEITQGGSTIAITRVTMLASSDGIEWNTQERLSVAPIGCCVPLDPPMRVIHLDRAEALIDPSSLPFSGGPRAVVRGYLRPLENRRVDAPWLAMASDWFPPPAFVRSDPPAGGISVDLTTHIHRTLPPLGDDWLVVEFRLDTSVGGLATEHGRIETLDGTVVAESLQTRWTAHG